MRRKHLPDYYPKETQVFVAMCGTCGKDIDINKSISLTPPQIRSVLVTHVGEQIVSYQPLICHHCHGRQVRKR
jgi:hypothetical protein